MEETPRSARTKSNFPTSSERRSILTFHSGEDRLVKHYFKEGKKAGLYQEISEEVIRPSAEECQRNPRARSTKMRWAIRAQE